MYHEQMGTATTRLTPEEYLSLPEEQIFRTELIDGEIVSTGNALLKHEIVKMNLLAVLTGSVGPDYRVTSETMFRVVETEFLQPDVAIISRSRLASMDANLHAVGAPDIAVEVVSSESAATLERKVALYLEAGSAEAWVFYPDAKVVFVHQATGAKRLRGEQPLTSEMLPGLSVPVSKFFEKP
jgi:Uma2 family endonuclease